VKEPKKTKGGIFIPESATEKPQQAIVVEVGDDKKNITVKKGDRVIYEKFGGTEIEIDGETHLIIKMNEILAVIKK
jgi:chaperonin GroES